VSGACLGSGADVLNVVATRERNRLRTARLNGLSHRSNNADGAVQIDDERLLHEIVRTHRGAGAATIELGLTEFAGHS
jgi:hypothetical protein